MSFARAFVVLLLCTPVSSALAQLAFAPAVNYPSGNFSRGVAVADFNRDGRPDLAVVDQNNGGGAGMVSILLATGAPGSFGAPTVFTLGNQPTAIVAADFNGDGNPDLAVTVPGANTVSILLGNGSGGFTGPVTFAAGTVFGIATGDFNGDGRIDLAMARVGPQDLSIWLGNGDGTFTAGASVGSAPLSGVVTGYFNGDAFLDVAAIDTNNNMLHVFLGNGDGTFAASAGGMATGVGPFGLAVGDFNADGHADIAVANQGNSVSIFLGNGTGGFTAGTALAVSSSPRGVMAADLDRDGRIDLVVVVGNSNRLDVFKGNGDGTFAAPLALATGLAPVSGVVADLNGDARPDIVVANLTGDNVSVFLSASVVAPLPPTGVTATAGNGQASIAFTPPTDAASLPVIDYTVTCGIGTSTIASATGTASPIRVTGLTNGIAYSCTVTARNANGTGTPSAAVSVTPRDDTPRQVPTLSEAAMLLLALLMMILAARRLSPCPAGRSRR